MNEQKTPKTLFGVDFIVSFFKNYCFFKGGKQMIITITFDQMIFYAPHMCFLLALLPSLMRWVDSATPTLSKRKPETQRG